MKKLTCTIVAAIFAAFATANADLTGSLETSVVSNYTYHGQVVDRNSVFVPKLSLQSTLVEGGSLVFSVEQILGTKGSTYYRTQYNAGIALQLGSFTLTPGYRINAYPDRDKETTQSVTGSLTFNDSGLLPVSLKPTLAFEKATDPRGGSWYEASVSPGKTFGKLDLTVPIAFGAASNGYFTPSNKDLHYCYASVGVAATLRVTDKLSLKAGVTGVTTDNRLGNASNNFVQSQLGVAVSF